MFDPDQRQSLLALARQSIGHGLETGRALPVSVADYPSLLGEPRACFVTLHIERQLRGCIGSLEARRPLVEDVAENAFAAAFRDPRFAPLARHEMSLIDIELSVLSRPRPIRFESQQQLLEQLEPGVDGLILEAGRHRGTFLPSVWQQLPEPRDFLRHLKIKAGLTADAWPADIRISRYSSESFAEPGPTRL